MARVTIQDCLAHVANRFDLVITASRRAHDLELGMVTPLVPEDNDKPTVIALREIAAGYDVSAVQEEDQGGDRPSARVLALAEAAKRAAGRAVDEAADEADDELGTEAE
ncbi:MAG: hypothetical protein A3J38_03570 [Gammaproteobacteria bacterium RIFCSPHIGHO2_12_FULL_45_9]|nr:MAG: hypothetical protein A3J38_03570 [Gammaproteobacteria bacterium RIFCSPHIGHO2_12_FULL_45_9]